MDDRRFREAVGLFASGVTVVTVRTAQGTDLGMTVSAFCSLSLDPPLVLACVGSARFMHAAMAEATGFGVSVLADDQGALSDRFAGGMRDAQGSWTPWPEERDRFEGLTTRRAEQSDALLLDGALVGLDCRLHGSHDQGDHTLFFGEVVGFERGRDGKGPLLYQSGRYASLGEPVG